MPREFQPPMYLEMTQPHVDVRFGKLAPGRIVPVQPDVATRWMGAGVAKESSESAYNKQRDERVGVGDRRVAALQQMNDPDSAMWDVHYRDAVLADPEKLKEAMDRGVVPTNLSTLQDDDGIPLDRTASYEDIMDARENLQHPDAAIDAHTSASTSGNRSHYTEPVPEKQRPQTEMSTATPNKRVGRIQRSQVANASEEPRSAPDRSTRTMGDSLGNVRTEKA
jgi:hypothetical protein